MLINRDGERGGRKSRFFRRAAGECCQEPTVVEEHNKQQRRVWVRGPGSWLTLLISQQLTQLTPVLTYKLRSP